MPRAPKCWPRALGGAPPLEAGSPPMPRWGLRDGDRRSSEGGVLDGLCLLLANGCAAGAAERLRDRPGQADGWERPAFERAGETDRGDAGERHAEGPVRVALALRGPLDED